MLSYWLMYLLPGVAAIFMANRLRDHTLRPWVGMWLLYVILIGLRFEVGGDWFNYLRHYEFALHYDLKDILLGKGGDPGYVLLNWIAANNDRGMEFVSLVCAIVFVTGLINFCRQQPAPWIGFAVAVPYLVIVLGMGYTRQGVALGLLFWALIWLERRHLWHFLFFIGIAAMFHKSAVILVPLGLFVTKGNWLYRIIAVASVLYGLWNLTLADAIDSMWVNYVDAQMQSSGARVRVLMNLLPGLVLLFFHKRWRVAFPEGRFWYWMALGSIAAAGLVEFASTAVDRLSLYLTPLQVVVLSRLPFLLCKEISPETLAVITILGYAAVLFVWLNYATHAVHWIPYQNTMFLW
ncbi:EpsG family protein [Solemya velum gill symbiont]|uniref:EpsG family protein n=1 Tax=Solemya velum gill symbiont TaxID=2340 RepID=UPI0009968F6D|nr:EpsG family protein [Solemya velum gill symbiont]